MEETRYPCRPEEGVAWKLSTLYSIAGWMIIKGWQSSIGFGGYFRHYEDDNSVEGEGIDILGSSKIRGRLMQDSLIFDKEYLYMVGPTPSGVIKCNLVKMGDYWRGEFLLQSGIEGDVECTISRSVDNAFGLVLGPGCN